MFINYYTPSQGGMETSLINLCAGLKKAGHETFIFAPRYPNWEEKEKNVFRYRSIHFSYAGYLYAIPITFFSGMEKIVESLNLDIIHSHQPYSLGNEAMKFSKNLGIPLVFTYHIRYEDYSHYIPFIPGFISKPFIKRIAVSYANKCDAVIAPGSAIKNLLTEEGVRSSVKIIPNGIDIENFGMPRGTREIIRKKYGIRPDEIVLITTSRIAFEKNIGFLIKSFALIKKSAGNAKFLIVGQGGVRKKLEDMAKNLNLASDIIFTGLASKEEIINLYQASDIFVFSSLTEVLPTVAIEAIAAGLPVVAIRASGTEDIIRDGENGFLVSNSEKEFAEKVFKIVGDKNLREQSGAQAKIDSKKFSIELWTEKMVELYESLI